MSTEEMLVSSLNYKKVVSSFSYFARKVILCSDFLQFCISLFCTSYLFHKRTSIMAQNVSFYLFLHYL